VWSFYATPAPYPNSQFRDINMKFFAVGMPHDMMILRVCIFSKAPPKMLAESLSNR
jgi:hypothetical protein